MIPNTSNTYHFETAARLALPNLKKQTNTIIKKKFLDKYNEQAAETNFQGEFFTLLNDEKRDITWKGYIYSVPRGVMAFAMRCSTNSLATPDNLARWGKVVDPSCKLCSTANSNSRTTATLGHILNNCPCMLDRYEWRHNGVLSYLYKTFKENKPEMMDIFADLDGAKISGGTIPPHIVTTAQRPDIVTIDRSSNPPTVILVELTIPFTRNIADANTRKQLRYEFLAADIEAAGYKCINLPIEIFSRGHITSRNRNEITFLAHQFKIRKLQQVLRACSKLSLLASYSIFNSRNEESWSRSGYLKP